MKRNDHAPPQGLGHDYTQIRRGYYGRLGGSKVVPAVRFIQTGFGMNELEQLTLVANLPGSDKWPIRELFQRDIDESRVEREIMPYLRSGGQFRYFNPLTIAVLPVEPDGRVKQARTGGGTRPQKDGNLEYSISEVVGHYQLEECETTGAYSVLRWNPSTVRLVAIDGQHRLSALKRLAKLMTADAASEEDRAAATWIVPVVLVAIPEVHWKSSKAGAGILEVVRDIFTRVNMTAQDVNPSRAVLLDDSSPISVCVQEFLQASHAGEPGCAPLTLFDWRGDPTQRQESALLTAEELRTCFGSYVLGLDLAGWRRSLDFESAAEGPTPLSEQDFCERTSRGESEHVLKDHEASRKMRARFRSELLMPLMRIFAEVAPFKAYVAALRRVELEREKAKDDISIYVLDRLRYGRSREDDALRVRVKDGYAALVKAIDVEQKKALTELLRLDIGQRAIFAAYGALKPIYDEFLDRTASWDEFTTWFVGVLNKAISSGLFKDNAKTDLYICRERSGRIINYRPGLAGAGLGALTALKCLSQDSRVPDALLAKDSIVELVDKLRKTLVQGITRDIRPAWKEKYPNNTKLRNAKIRDEAQKLSAVTLRKLLSKSLLAHIE